MTVKQFIKILEKEDPNEEIYIWRGNGHTNYDYSSNLMVLRPYGQITTNNGSTRNPLIISNNHKKDGF